MSRRAADTLIAEQRIQANGVLAELGQDVHPHDQVMLDGNLIVPAANHLTVMLHKPVGYVVSRDGQGNPTIYDLLSKKYHHLKPVGRLDKDSSGLLLLTNDGQLAHALTHPSFQKEKIYEIELDKSLSAQDKIKIKKGIKLDDGISHLKIKPHDKTGRAWRITMTEGRNRQIRRTFAALGYDVIKLHRTHFGAYELTGSLPTGAHRVVIS